MPGGDTVPPVHAVAYEVEIRIPNSHSLKDRRQVVRSLLAVTRERFHVSAAEARLAEATIDEIDRYLWSRPEIEMLDCTTHWLT